jgi:hypothetical protein
MQSMLVFWVVTSYGIVSRYQRFEEIYCFHFQYCLQIHTALLLRRPTSTSSYNFTLEDGDSKFLRNAGIYLQVQMVLLPRRTTPTYSSPWEPDISQRQSENEKNRKKEGKNEIEGEGEGDEKNKEESKKE